jgi:hypothetical protein
LSYFALYGMATPRLFRLSRLITSLLGIYVNDTDHSTMRWFKF